MRHRATPRAAETVERVRRLLLAGSAAVRAPGAENAPSGRRGIVAAAAAAAAAVIAAVLVGGWVLASEPRADRGPAAAASEDRSAAMSPAAGPARTTAATPSDLPLVVDVAGKVRHPGLYRLARGARVDDALRAAGGALPGTDLTTLNRAAPVADGQQVLVGLAGPVPQHPGSPGSAPTRATPVAVNSATIEQLQTLPGVGPVLAQHIVDWRTQHGGFTTIDQLRSVSGIGPAKFAGLKDLVSL